MKRIAIFAAALVLMAGPAYAQFYKDKTLVLLVNYGVGGNADTEARVYQKHLGKHIPGNPNIIVQNAPGAGGFNAFNLLGLGINYKPDGLTAGYFTVNAIAPIIDDPALKVKVHDFIIIGGARGWTIAYGRKDILPSGIQKPSDLAKATKVFVGGYSRSAAHDTRLRLALEIMNVPYTVVTGYPGTAQINKAMLQNEVNFSGSSLPGYQTQVVPQIIETGVGMPYFHYPVFGPNGQPVGNPSLEAQGIKTFDKVYEDAFGKPPSGAKFNALLFMNDLGTKLQRAILLPNGSPPEAVAALRQAFDSLGKDRDFIEDFKRVTREEPDLVKAEDLEPLFERIRKIDPEIKRVLKESVGIE